MSDFKPFPDKHPTAKLDYLFDWAPKRNNRGTSNWLRPDEIIESYTLVVTDGITKLSEGIVDEGSGVQIVVTGGTVSTTYNISCSIVTNQGREDTRTGTILVKPR